MGWSGMYQDRLRYSIILYLLILYRIKEGNNPVENTSKNKRRKTSKQNIMKLFKVPNKFNLVYMKILIMAWNFLQSMLLNSRLKY